ncbi:MAG: YecA family protein [Methylomicrobium sp.]
MVYQTIDRELHLAGADVSAAEAHGIATGLLCVDARAEKAAWLLALLGDEFSEVEDYPVLADLFEQVRGLVVDDQYLFDLLLPEADGEDLSDKAEAMRDWCQGFLYGIGYSRSSSQWSGDVGEILKDIVEITKMDVPDEKHYTEEDEAACAEIQEYLRVAVQLIRNEFSEAGTGVAH